MNKRLLALLSLAMILPPVAYAATSGAAACCPGLCCILGCAMCP